MSHFTCLVIGENPAEQLSPFSEHLEMPEYKKEIVSIKDKRRFIKTYTKMTKGRTYAILTPNQEKENKKLSFDELYEKYGEDWNGKTWKKDENGKWAEYSTNNQNGKHDWFEVGGRWTGYFKLKKGASGTVGKPGLMTEPAKPGYADQVLKKDIDFAFMENASAKKAASTYDIAMKIFGRLPKNKSWDSMIKKLKDKDSRKKLDKIKKSYWNQPRCKAWSDAEKKCHEEKKKFHFGFFDSPDEFLISKKQYVQNAKDNSICSFAVLKDGRWYERGEMGWFGIVHTNENEITNKIPFLEKHEEWHEKFKRLVLSVPDDTLLSIYDCHI